MVFDGGGVIDARQIVFEGGGERMVVPGSDLVEVAPYFLNPGHALIFKLNDTDAALFADLTERLIGQPLSVSVCDQELARPVVQDRLQGGSGIVPVVSVEVAVAMAAALRGEADCPPIPE